MQDSRGTEAGQGLMSHTRRERNQISGCGGAPLISAFHLIITPRGQRESVRSSDLIRHTSPKPDFPFIIH